MQLVSQQNTLQEDFTPVTFHKGGKNQSHNLGHGGMTPKQDKAFILMHHLSSVQNHDSVHRSASHHMPLRKAL